MNDDGPKLFTVALFAIAGVIVYKKVVASKPIKVIPQAGLAPGLGSFEKMRYKAIKRGDQTACYDVQTRKRVPKHLCEAEMLQDVGGLFGGSGGGKLGTLG